MEQLSTKAAIENNPISVLLADDEIKASIAWAGIKDAP